MGVLSLGLLPLFLPSDQAPPLPHIVMFLDVNLMEHHILLLGVDVCFHLHGNMAGQDRQQQPLLRREAEAPSQSPVLPCWPVPTLQSSTIPLLAPLARFWKLPSSPETGKVDLCVQGCMYVVFACVCG